MARPSGSQMRLVWLWLTLEEFGKRPEFKTLNDRIELQKLVYLAQEATGVSVYHFNPYIRGPYSPSLTRDLYGLLEPGRMKEAKEEAAAYKLNSSTMKDLDRAKKVVDKGAPPRLVDWLELVASMHYKHVESGGDFNETWGKVNEWKEGIFDEHEAHSAWTSLKRCGLVST